MFTQHKRSTHRLLVLGCLPLLGASHPSTGHTQQQQRHSRLILQIHSVKCIDETNGKYIEKIGGDEIVLSAVSVDTKGRAKRVPTLRLGKFERDGITKTFSPARSFATFDL